MMWKREIKRFLVHNRIVAEVFMLTAYKAVTIAVIMTVSLAVPVTVYGVELSDEEIFGTGAAAGI